MEICGIMMWDIASLFRSYSGDLQRFLQRRGSTHDVACDLTQEAFLRLITLQKKDVPSAPLQNHKAYLYRIAANLQIDYARHLKTMPLTAYHSLLSETLADHAPLADDILIFNQTMHLVEQALAEVPDAVRQIYFLRLDGFTFAEISAQLEIPLQTAYSQWGRVMMHLQYRLQSSHLFPKGRKP